MSKTTEKMEVIDFFSGFGGATEGLQRSDHVKVVAAINHDKYALGCHAANHPHVTHYNMDVREVDEHELVNHHPNVRGFWWSAECTHFSIAKGGDTRCPDSRMLNDELKRFMRAYGDQLEYVFIENVQVLRSIQ